MCVDEKLQNSWGHAAVEPSLHLGSVATGALHSGHVLCLSSHLNTQSSQNMCYMKQAIINVVGDQEGFPHGPGVVFPMDRGGGGGGGWFSSMDQGWFSPWTRRGFPHGLGGTYMTSEHHGEAHILLTDGARLPHLLYLFSGGCAPVKL